MTFAQLLSMKPSQSINTRTGSSRASGSGMPHNIMHITSSINTSPLYNAIYQLLSAQNPPESM